jgi:hypothetical protein
MSAITYTQSGEYLIPDLTIPEMPESLGKYGMMRKNYLHNHRGTLYTIFSMKGTLFPHCLEIEKQAEARLTRMMAALTAKSPPPNKAADPMGWAAHMNSLKAQAEEVILRELIYN